MPASALLPRAALVQLPFPSQEDPCQALCDYYDRYQQRYREVIPDYGVGTGDLWELPLWVAHLDGAIGRDDTVLLDLSGIPCLPEACIASIARECDTSTVLFFSPLAQNFDLARNVSRLAQTHGYRTAVGGNMAVLASTDDFTWVVTTKFDSESYEAMVSRPPGMLSKRKRSGIRHEPVPYRPSYRLVSDMAGRFPLLRIHASHGCLFACTFCGDAWSRELHVVRPSDLRLEVEELRQLFPDVRLIYVGDKTFGQSEAAMDVLTEALRDHSDLRLVVQTHVMMIKPRIVERMVDLSVSVAEMGFETGSSSALAAIGKGKRKPEDVENALDELGDAGIKPILNVLGGLPRETAATHDVTREFLRSSASKVWLFNLYNFVPYPLAPLFQELRPRIFDWEFGNWREDRPVVFTPYHQSVDESWDQFGDLIDLCAEFIRA